MEDIVGLRKDIDSIDGKIVELFEKRMETVLKIAEYKRQNGIEILNRAREEEVINKCINRLQNKSFTEPLEKLMNSLMEISREVQNNIMHDNSRTYNKNSKLKIGFQGVSGSFSEQALFEYFGNNVDTMSVKEFQDIFIELQNDEIDYGILPIENSSTGGVSEVYDLLGKYNFKIIGEVSLKVEHHLMGIPGTRLDDIVEVYSHSQAFSQCSEFLKQHDSWKLIPYYNTAKSAELVCKTGCKNMAAIGSSRAAALYNLEIIENSINSNSNNYTRFIIIAKNIETDDRSNKISIVFSTSHRAGALYNGLQYFAENNINLLKIESRPIKNKPWEYLFYIDCEGNLNDEVVKKAIKALESKSTYFKILGNYVRHL
jgi:chorismate mutase/prephenate dehydratase